MNWKKAEIVFELIVFGIIIGIIEDLVAVYIVTGEPITWHIFGIIVLIAIPFAIIGEVIFDRINFARIFKKLYNRGIHACPACGRAIRGEPKKKRRSR